MIPRTAIRRSSLFRLYIPYALIQKAVRALPESQVTDRGPYGVTFRARGEEDARELTSRVLHELPAKADLRLTTGFGVHERDIAV